MLKKAKLYSLLAIIVASTVVGLLGLPQTAQAQTTECPSGKDCITWEGTNKTNGYYDYLNYKGETYDFIGSGAIYSQDKDFKNSACGDAPLVYRHAADDGSGLQRGYHIICFKSGSSEATLVYFPIAYFTGNPLVSCVDVQCGDGNIFEFSPDGMTSESNITVVGEPIDLGNAEEELEDDEDALNSGKEEGQSASSCQIKGIGWLLCPVIFFLAEVTDNSYNILNHTFLKLEPIALPGSESNEDSMRLYTSWRAMRDFANVVFIIGFLIIVFSQITNIGVSNYGIKRLLPKIIIAAILVNLSYYICAIAVDLSNILGNSLRGMLMSIGTESSGAGPLSFTIRPDGVSGEGYDVTNWQDLTNVIIGSAGVALATAGVGIAVYAFLPVFLPLILSAAIAILTVVIALTIRQALIVILIVVSPLAFVALLLPNTESYFQKWKSLFVAMLLVYPIISVIFGASALAAKILMATNDFPTQMVGAGVSIIPLFLTPIVMKASGGLLNRWVGLVNNPNKGPVDALRKGAEGKSKRWENRRKVGALRGGGTAVNRFRYRRAAKGAAVDAQLESRAKSAGTSYVAKEARENTEFQNELAGGMNVPIVGGLTIPNNIPLGRGRSVPVPLVGGTTIPTVAREASADDRRSVEASAVSAQSAERQKEIKERETLLLEEHPRDLEEIAKELVRAVRNQEETTALAAQNILLTRGDGGINNWRGAMQTVDADGNTASETVTAMREDVVQSHPDIKNYANDVAKFGTESPRTLANPVSTHTTNSTTWNISDQQFFTQKTSSQLNATTIPGAISVAQAQRLLKHTLAANFDPSVRANLDHIARGISGPLPPAPPPPVIRP